MKIKQKLVIGSIAFVAMICISHIFTFAASAPKNQPPNVLIIIADDATYNDLPLYGGLNVKTPNIDQLSKEGLTFNKAFLSMSMCAPCRAELYTGMYPARNGVCWNHSPVRSGTKSIVHHLGDLGYRVGIAGKIHVSPQEIFPFEKVEGLERDCGSKTAKYDPSGLKMFINQDKNQPFCLVVALVVPHVPWTVGDPSHFNPEELKLPPYLADTPETRENYARYLAEIEVLDIQVGKTLKMLKETGEANNTIVIFTSEQGSQFPGCKWTNWNTGVHTGFIVRWPGKVQAGTRSDALIQYADVLPTLVEAAGGNPQSAFFSGSSFLPVLLGKTDHHRNYAYFMHNNVPAGPPYPIRSVTDGKYHYIRNLRPELLNIQKHMMSGMGENHYWSSWLFYASDNNHTLRMVNRTMNRPKEQLYRMDKDPYEMKNLSKDPEYSRIKKRLSDELSRWMKIQGDPGALLDTREQWQAAKEGNHFNRKDTKDGINK